MWPNGHFSLYFIDNGWQRVYTRVRRLRKTFSNYYFIILRLIKMTTRTNFYTPGGWAGSRHDYNLSMKDITKAIREYAKKNYPKFKFSVTTPHYSSINIALMAGPVSPFATPDVEKVPLRHHSNFGGAEQVVEYWKNTIEAGHASVNHYYINDDYRLTDKTKIMLEDIKKFAQSFNYDDSDSMTDYFDTNFYLSMGIGKWDKKFKHV